MCSNLVCTNVKMLMSVRRLLTILTGLLCMRVPTNNLDNVVLLFLLTLLKAINVVRLLLKSNLSLL